MDLSALANMFVSSATPTSIAPSQSGTPWQEELRAQIDPAAQRKRQISSALLAAAGALAGSKGQNFLPALSQGIVAGAQQYHDQGDANQKARIDAMRGMDEYDQGQTDRKLGLLKDAIGVQGGMEDRADRRDYEQQRLDIARQRANRPAASRSPGNAMEVQMERNRVAANKEFSTWLAGREKAANDSLTGSVVPPSEDEKQAKWNELMDRYGIRSLYEKQAEPQTVAPGRTDQEVPKNNQGAPGQPKVQQYREGDTAINRKTGARMVFKNGKWVPL